jgi:hypothetical protein
MTTCASCGADVKQGAKFCGSCGQPVASAAFPSEVWTGNRSEPDPVSRGPMSTSRFAILAGLLVVMIGVIGGVLFLLLQSDSSSSDDAAGTRSSTTSEATTTAPSATTTTVAPVSPPSISFDRTEVRIGQPVAITASSARGEPIARPTLTVDGAERPIVWTRDGSTWTGNWIAPTRDGPRQLVVTVESATKTQMISVRLPADVERAMARINEFITALAAGNLEAVNQIVKTRKDDLTGYEDVKEARVFYLSHTPVGPKQYTIETAYVVHQRVPPGEPGAGTKDTAFFCTAWTVDLNPPSNGLEQGNSTIIEQRATQDHPIHNAKPGWVDFAEYRARLDECR